MCACTKGSRVGAQEIARAPVQKCLARVHTTQEFSRARANTSSLGRMHTRDFLRAGRQEISCAFVCTRSLAGGACGYFACMRRRSPRVSGAYVGILLSFIMFMLLSLCSLSCHCVSSVSSSGACLPLGLPCALFSCDKVASAPQFECLKGPVSV